MCKSRDNCNYHRMANSMESSFCKNSKICLLEKLKPERCIERTNGNVTKPNTTKPVTEPVTEPIKDPGTDPVTDPVTAPVTDSVTDPVTDPVTYPVTDPVTDPVTEPNGNFTLPAGNDTESNGNIAEPDVNGKPSCGDILNVFLVHLLCMWIFYLAYF